MPDWLAGGWLAKAMNAHFRREKSRHGQFSRVNVYLQNKGGPVAFWAKSLKLRYSFQMQHLIENDCFLPSPCTNFF